MKGLTKRLTAAILLAAVCLTATVYSRTRPVELRLGFMAGSYWDAPNGNCYAVIDAAIERFEREHPNVHVTYTSGILKRDYSEWLIDQYLLGSEPDVFLVLPEDFGELCELGALAPRFRNYDQALLFTEGLVQNAMEDEHNLSLQLQRVQHQVQEYLQE